MKAKGEVLIVIGSIGMTLGSIGVIIAGIIVIFAFGWLVSVLDAEALGFLFMGGWGLSLTVIGVLMAAFGVLFLILSIMAFRRRNNPLKSTFCIVVGSIFVLLAIVSLISAVSFGSISSLVLAGLVLVGGILNSQQKAEYRAFQQQAPFGQQLKPY